MTDCTCPHDAGELLRARIDGTASHCPTHDPAPTPETPEPLALNDGDGLARAITAKLTTPETGDHS